MAPEMLHLKRKVSAYQYLGSSTIASTDYKKDFETTMVSALLDGNDIQFF